MKLIKIEVYDKREKTTTTLYVEQLSENRFRMTDNDIFNCRLTLGTEFETRLNADGKHEIVRITKASEFLTRRFLLSSKHTESAYRLLGDEITRQGGFWQVDFGGLATVNLPKASAFDLDQAMTDLGFGLTEITDDDPDR
ncbi:MAG: hypothetical protein H6556_10235 [Lewinellaceae bacterium]|nr:hypothetical protein [Lewinellaceae bacterium]